jgi:transposase
MLAEELDFVIGVDTHRDGHALALVSAKTGALLAEGELTANTPGYRRALTLARRLARGRRAWAIEGAGSYGAGLTRFLAARGEPVLEVERAAREPRRRGAKSDRIDALRAAQAALRAAQAALRRERMATPRAGGRREALRVLLRTREGAVAVRRAALNQLRALLVAASASAEAGPLQRDLELLVRELAPQLLAETGVGPICAAQLIVSWSHAGRFVNEAAFARHAAAAPIPASSGQVLRHRLDRGGDRQLNRALHTILVARHKRHAPTIAYIDRRRTEGKSVREALRCLKRFLARHLFRVLERTMRPPVLA